jgi:hypothetical protein
MKKLLAIGILFIIASAAHAQCNQTVTWTASKTEYVDASGAVQNVKTDALVIKTTADHITVTVTTNNDDSEIIEGDVKNLVCAWTDAFKNGKTSFTSVLAKANGETKNADITIEGKNEKIMFLVEMANMNGVKMRIPVDGYKEQR